MNINIKCNRLDCTGDLFDFYGNYTKSIQFCDFANPVYFNNNTENVQFELTETGWELGYNVVIFNDTVSFVSSKNQRVKNFDLKYEYPKYGTYIADTGSVVNIEIEKDEYDDVVLLSSSDEVKFNNKIFTKSHQLHNQRSVWHFNEELFIYYFKNEINNKEGWCVNDILTDKNVKYKQNIRTNSGGRDLDEIYGVYYMERDGVIDFNLENCLVANAEVLFTTTGRESINSTRQINESDPDSFTYKVSTRGSTKVDTDAFEVRKLTSSSSNLIETYIPFQFKYKPSCFERDVRSNPIFNIETNGKFDSNEKLKIDINYLDFQNTITIENKLSDSFDRVTGSNKLIRRIELYRTDTDQDTTSTRSILRHLIGKQISDNMPEINRINLNIELNIDYFRDRTRIYDNEFLIEEDEDLVESFKDDGDEDDAKVERIVEIKQLNKYKVNTDYRLCDVNRIKTPGKLISQKKSKLHKSSKRRLFRRNSINNVNSTIDMFSVIQTKHLQ